jgi:hypothetical protein
MGLLPLMEEQLAPFNPIIHWAMLFTLLPSIVQPKFKKLASKNKNNKRGSAKLKR